MESYLSYKDSGVEWIGEIPSRWESKRLKHISNFQSGYSFKSEDFSIEERIPVIRIGDVGDRIDFSKCVKLPETFLNEHKDFIIKKNDIMVGMTGGTIGKSGKYIYDEPSLLNQRVCLLRNKSSILNGLLYYYVKSEIFKRYIFFYCYGGGQDNIGREDIMNMIIPLSPKETQIQIVSFLDFRTQKIDDLIEKTDKKIELLKEKRTSLINHCVTKGLNSNVEMKDSGVEWIGNIPRNWDVKKIKYLGIIKSGDGVVNTELDDSKEYPVYGGNGIMGYYDYFNREETILVIGRVGEKCGNVHLVKEKCWVTDNSLILNLLNNDTCDWVYYSLDTRKLNTLRNQNTQPLITSTLLKNESIPYPSENEQTQIVEYLDEQIQKIDSTIEKETKRIELLKEYRQSLISEVVTGKIDVRDWKKNN